jgi:cytochrome c-type biogenesis protein CcmH
MMRPLRCALLAILLAFAGVAASQAIDPLPFKDHTEELRFQNLTRQLRCLVCQNEDLADSNAGLARDLRHEVFQLMQQGQSDAQIKQYLVDRYSDFVLYDPPVQANTWLLWFGPLLILLAGASVVAVTIRKRGRAGARGTTADDGDPSDDKPAGNAPVDNGDDW